MLDILVLFQDMKKRFLAPLIIARIAAFPDPVTKRFCPWEERFTAGKTKGGRHNLKPAHGSSCFKNACPLARIGNRFKV